MSSTNVGPESGVGRAVRDLVTPIATDLGLDVYDVE